ncbi:MAG: TRAP-type transport system small permease protein [Thermoanaerobacteraceae bacterium]|nr:TRAP-type transport system small permease protein [Thermoanaerobacteraceae bacterium]
MKKLLSFLFKAEEEIAKLLLIFIVIFVFIASLARWLHHPIPGSVDIAQLLFGWVCFLGADQALREERHIGVDIITRMFPVKIQRNLSLINYSLITVFLVIISIFGVYLSIVNYERLFNTIPISYSFATVSVPVGAMLMLRTAVSKIYKIINNSI